MMSLKKSVLTSTLAVGLLSLAAAAQSASGSANANANASVTPGQANAGASVNQNANAQAAGASANANANAKASAQASHDQQNNDQQSNDQQSKDQKSKPEPKAKAGDSGKQQSSGGGSTAAASGMLSSGTNLQAELTKPVDAKKAKPGDPVEAKVTQDVKSDGKVVIHRGSRLIGHVTEAQARTKEQASSTLGIAFDKAVLKGGQEMQFSSVIQAIAPPVQASLSSAADDNVGIAGGSPAPQMSAPRTGGGSLVGGVASTAGGVVSGATSATTSATGAVNGSVNGTVSGATRATSGLTAQGNLTSASQGAIGLQGLVLSTPTTVTGSAQGSAQAQGSVISSASHNVHLDGGTQMLLRVTGSAQ